MNTISAPDLCPEDLAFWSLYVNSLTCEANSDLSIRIIKSTSLVHISIHDFKRGAENAMAIKYALTIRGDRWEVIRPLPDQFFKRLISGGFVSDPTSFAKQTELFLAFNSDLPKIEYERSFDGFKDYRMVLVR